MRASFTGCRKPDDGRDDPRFSAVFAIASITGCALVLGACAGGGQPGHTFEVVEEDGIPVAVSSEIPKFGGELFTYEKILVIRPDPDNRESLLYRPEFFTMGNDGLYYVADRGNHRVAVFDADGSFVRTFGREGEGPGELRNPYLLSLQGDRVFVFNGRTTVFRTDGTYIDVLSFPGGRFAQPAGDGSLFVEDTMRGGPDGEYMTYSARARIVDASGEVVATIETPMIRTASLAVFGGAAGAFFRPGGEILTTTGMEPEIAWYDLDGRMVRKARIDLPPEPVTETDKAAVAELWDRLIENVASVDGETAGRNLEALKASIIYPQSKAYWERPVIDDIGWLWLPAPVPDTGMSSMGSVPIEAQPWFRVLDADGEFIGVTEWPAEATDVSGSTIVAGRLLTMTWDDAAQDLLPTVYRIRSTAEGLVYPSDGG